MNSAFGGGSRMKQAQEALEGDPEIRLAQNMNQLSLEEVGLCPCAQTRRSLKSSAEALFLIMLFLSHPPFPFLEAERQSTV